MNEKQFILMESVCIFQAHYEYLHNLIVDVKCCEVSQIDMRCYFHRISFNCYLKELHKLFMRNIL